MILSDEERKKHNREKMRKWRKEHPEKEVENREKNREKIRASHRKWVDANREKEQERLRKYRKEHPEKIRKQARERWKSRYLKDPEKYRKQAREWGQKNKDKVRERIKKWRLKNREKIQACRIANQDEIKKKRDIKQIDIKTTVMANYSKKLSNSDVPCCNCCGENQFLIFLTIDHIKGWKNYNEPDLSHRRGQKRLGGKELYRYLQKNNFPSGYQVLCMNCNSAKSDNEVCPHQRGKK